MLIGATKKTKLDNVVRSLWLWQKHIKSSAQSSLEGGDTWAET